MMRLRANGAGARNAVLVAKMSASVAKTFIAPGERSADTTHLQIR